MDLTERMKKRYEEISNGLKHLMSFERPLYPIEKRQLSSLIDDTKAYVKLDYRPAVCDLAKVYYKGFRKGRKIMIDLLKKGHKLEIDEVSFLLAKLYLEGEPKYLDKDEKQAVQIFEDLAKKDNKESLEWTAKAYRDGTIVQKNKKKALFYFSKLANIGDDEAMVECAKLTENEKNKLDYMRIAYEKGNSRAGEWLFEHKELLSEHPNLLSLLNAEFAEEKDIVGSYKIYKELSDKEFMSAKIKCRNIREKIGVFSFEHGLSIELGIGRNTDVEGAINEYFKLARLEDKRSKDRLKELADKDNMYAQLNYAQVCENIEEATNYFQKVIMKNNREYSGIAYNCLYSLYKENDFSLACHYLNESINCGNEESRREMEQIRRNLGQYADLLSHEAKQPQEGEHIIVELGHVDYKNAEKDEEDDEPKKESQEVKTFKSAECAICMDKQTDIIFIPCGHVCCCSECAKKVEKCPICRKDIKFKVDKDPK